eukprot:3910129-Prymnesium_polylepis.1
MRASRRRAARHRTRPTAPASRVPVVRVRCAQDGLRRRIKRTTLEGSADSLSHRCRLRSPPIPDAASATGRGARPSALPGAPVAGAVPRSGVRRRA